MITEMAGTVSAGMALAALAVPATLLVVGLRRGARPSALLKGALLFAVDKVVAVPFLLALFSAFATAVGFETGSELPIVLATAAVDLVVQLALYLKVVNAPHEQGNQPAFALGWGAASAVVTAAGVALSAVSQGMAGSGAALDVVRCAAFALGASAAAPLALTCFSAYSIVVEKGLRAALPRLAGCLALLAASLLCSEAASVLPSAAHLALQTAVLIAGCAGTRLAARAYALA